MGQKGQKKAQPTLNKHEVADCMIMLRSSNTCSAIHCTSLATNSCSVRNSLPAMNTASPTSAYLQHHHFWKSGAKRSSQIRCFKTPLSISSLCSQLPQCNPSCTRADSEVLCGQKGFLPAFLKAVLLPECDSLLWEGPISLPGNAVIREYLFQN